MKSLREIAASTPAEDPLEASIVASCLRYLNGLKGAHFQKRHGARTRSGDPDITGCWNGQHWEIEVKRGKNKPTKRQYSRLQDWSNAGAVVAWVCSLRELEELVARYRGTRELRCHPAIVKNADVRKYAHNLI